MPRLILRKDKKTGEPVKKRLVSPKKAIENNYLSVAAYDNQKQKEDLDLSK